MAEHKVSICKECEGKGYSHSYHGSDITCSTCDRAGLLFDGKKLNDKVPTEDGTALQPYCCNHMRSARIDNWKVRLEKEADLRNQILHTQQNLKYLKDDLERMTK